MWRTRCVASTRCEASKRTGERSSKRMGLLAAAAQAEPEAGTEAGSGSSSETAERFVQMPGGGRMPASGLGMCCRANAYEYESVYRQVLHYFLLGGRHLDT